MTLSVLSYIRLTLNLPHRVVLGEELGLGDGTAVKFQTRLWPLIEITIRVDEEDMAADGYELDPLTGLVTFDEAPAEAAIVVADYTWSVFSDDQITDLLDRYNDQIVPVKRDLIRALLANSDLFIKYTTGMESVDRSKALDALKGLLEELQGAPSTPMAQSVIWTDDDIRTYGRDVAWSGFVD